MAIEIELAPASDAFGAEDPRWLAQVAGLADELQQEGIALRTESTPVPGEKGGEIVTMIAALGSAGVFSAMVTVIQSWLSRERTRHLDIKIRSSGGTKHITIDGDTSNETLESLAREAIGQVDGS